MLAALSVTHGFLPPHPSPTALVNMFHANMGTTLSYGLILAIPAIILAGPVFASTLKKIPSTPLETFRAEELPADKLPSAMAVLTIAANLLYSLEPIIVDIIDYIGAPLTFISGGVVVLISGMALRKNSLNLFESTKNREVEIDAQTQEEKQRKSAYGFIFFLGASLGLGTTVMFNLFPDLFQVKLVQSLNNIEPKMVLVTILVISAFTSLPISSLVNRYGLSPSFWASLALLLISLAGLFTIDQVWLMLSMIGVFAVAFTIMSVSALPLAINRANYDEKVFCVGIFFSGVALPDQYASVLYDITGVINVRPSYRVYRLGNTYTSMESPLNELINPHNLFFYRMLMLGILVVAIILIYTISGDRASHGCV